MFKIKQEGIQRDGKKQYIDVTAKAIKKAIKSVAQGKRCCKTSQNLFFIL